MSRYRDTFRLPMACTKGKPWREAEGEGGRGRGRGVLIYVTGNLSNQEICKIPNIFRKFIKLLFHLGNLQIS